MMPNNYSEYSPPPPYNENCSVPITVPPPVYRPATTSRLFCGCGPKTWTKIIAILHIILCLGGLIAKLIATASGKPDLAEYEEPNDGYYGPYTKFNSDPKVQVLESAVGLLFGVMLLVGVHLGKPMLLLIWLVCAGIGIGMMSIVLIVFFLVVIFAGFPMMLLFIFILLIPFGIQIFCFHVVSLHRRELLDQQNLIQHPTVQFHSVYVDNFDKQNF